MRLARMPACNNSTDLSMASLIKYRQKKNLQRGSLFETKRQGTEDGASADLLCVLEKVKGDT